MLSALTVGLLALAASSEVAAAPQAGAKAHKVALQSRVPPKGQFTSVRKRASKAIGVPLDDFFMGTDLQWFGNISGLSAFCNTARGPRTHHPLIT